MLVRRPLHQRPDLGVAELGLGLPLELRVAEPHRDDRGATLAHVVALERGVLHLHEVAGLGVAVDRLCERPLEPLGVHPTFGGRDAVRIRVQTLVVSGVPLPRDLDLAFGPAVAVRADVLEQRLLGAVQVGDEVDDAGVVLEHLGVLVPRPLVVEHDRETTVQVRHHLEPLHHGRGAELDLLEHVGVGPERDRRAREPALRRPHFLQRSLRHTRPHDTTARLLGRVLLAVRRAVAVDLEHGALRQRVHHRHADAVQPTGHLVAAAPELPARVQRRHHDLRRRLALVLRVLVHRDAPAVVDHPHGAVGEQRHVDAVAVPGHRLVDRVVHDLPHEVVQARRPGRSDVHTGPLAHRVQAFEDVDVLGRVALRLPFRLPSGHPCAYLPSVARRAGACGARPRSSMPPKIGDGCAADVYVLLQVHP